MLLQTGERSAAWTDAVYLLLYLMLISSGELYWRSPVPRSSTMAAHRPRVQPITPLPYLAVASTYGLLLTAALDPWSDPISGIAVGAVLMTVLVVGRQLMAVRQNVRLLAENAARQNEARFRSLVQHSSDVIMVIKPDLSIKFVSPSVTRVLRYDAGPLMGRTVIDLLHPDDQERARTFLSDAVTNPGVTQPVEWRFRQLDGSLLNAETIATNLLEDPTVRGVVLNTRDVSERKRLEKELMHQAFHDPLTGLANRALFRDRVSHALQLRMRQRNAISVLFLDLDDFKKVNDSLGHAEGDRLLVAASERLQACVRAADTVARLGGDEFAILLEDGGAHVGTGFLVGRLVEAMARPFSLSGNEVSVSASIGIASASDDETADDLLRNADMAMYTAKRKGKGRCETYQSQMYHDLKQRLEMEAALRSAIEREELTLVYQPIFSLKNGKVHGVEALLRWEHPQFGHLLPQHFVPLAEETGLIVRLGRWVLREACRQVELWRAMYPELSLTMAVNVSGRQLHELDIVSETDRRWRIPGLSPMLSCWKSPERADAADRPGAGPTAGAQGAQCATRDDDRDRLFLAGLPAALPIDMIHLPAVRRGRRGWLDVELARAIIGLGRRQPEDGGRGRRERRAVRSAHRDGMRDGRATSSRHRCRPPGRRLLAEPGPRLSRPRRWHSASKKARVAG
jgi:diguanylate cyclase (GGDEF)-like protein/PAS domain S-box-containing protein